MGEAVGEASPGVDVEEHVGDAGAREAVVEGLPDWLDGRRQTADGRRQTVDGMVARKA